MKFWVNGFLNYTNQESYMIDLKKIYILHETFEFLPKLAKFFEFLPR